MYRLRDDLAREWETLATGPASAAAMGRWAAADDRLSGFDQLDGLIALVARPPSARAANDVLAALLRLGRDDALARRCLLEALMPGLVRLAGRYPSAGEDPDDRLQTVLSLAIERIPDLAAEVVAWPAVAIGGYVRDPLRRGGRPRPRPPPGGGGGGHGPPARARTSAPPRVGGGGAR